MGTGGGIGQAENMYKQQQFTAQIIQTLTITVRQIIGPISSNADAQGGMPVCRGPPAGPPVSQGQI